MNELVYEMISQLCELVPEGTMLVMAPGRAMLVDTKDLKTIRGVRFVANEIVGQAQEYILKNCYNEIKKKFNA